MKYKLFTHYIKIESHFVKTYGIKCYDRNGELRKIIYDISTNQNSAELMLNILQTGDFALEQIDGVVDDFFENNC